MRPFLAMVKANLKMTVRNRQALFWNLAFPAIFILIFVVLFVFCMQGTLGPLVWLMLAEIFPLKIRSFAIGICVFVLWIANAGVAFAFPPTVEALGIAPTFFIFAGLGLLALLFIWKQAPETRGRSLEQLEAQFRRDHA